MKTSTLITALSLCSFCSTSVPVSVEVQPGEDATLTCLNISKFDTNTYWFRLVNRTEVSCVAVMINSYSEVSYCDGVQKSKFEMTSNTSNLFLEIKQVDVSDSGLYFCGFNIAGILYFSTTRLSITGSDEQHVDMDIKFKKSDEVAALTSVMLGILTVLLIIVIIGLVVQNRKLQRARKEVQNPEQSKNMDTAEDLNYATVKIQRKARRREPEPNVIYAATR